MRDCQFPLVHTRMLQTYLASKQAVGKSDELEAIFILGGRTSTAGGLAVR